MLLDSNALIFWVTAPERLASGVLGLLDAAPLLAVSVASVWELEIKHGLGKLDVPLDWTDLTSNEVELWPIEIGDAVLAGSLPHHHRDPFDRMIIAQAIRRSLPIVTSDRAFERYDVPVIWA